MILKRYSVIQEGFWEYRIFDNEVVGNLDEYAYEYEEFAFEKCKELNRQLSKNSVYERNKAKAKTMKVSDKIKVCIQLADIKTSLSFEINGNALTLENLISNCKGCEISAVEIDSENKINEITVEEA